MVIIEGEGGRCDARCYNGRSNRCACVCGGRNHGIGVVAAVQKNWAQFGAQEPPNEYEALELVVRKLTRADRWGLENAPPGSVDRLAWGLFRQKRAQKRARSVRATA